MGERIPDDNHRNLLSSAARTASGTGGEVAFNTGLMPGAWPPNGLAFLLDVTVDESTAQDTLDVEVDAWICGVWCKIVAFTQHAGNEGADQEVIVTTPTAADASFAPDTAPSAGEAHQFWGSTKYRVRWTINDDSGSASFTFSVAAEAF